MPYIAEQARTLYRRYVAYHNLARVSVQRFLLLAICVHLCSQPLGPVGPLAPKFEAFYRRLPVCTVLKITSAVHGHFQSTPVVEID